MPYRTIEVSAEQETSERLHGSKTGSGSGTGHSSRRSRESDIGDQFGIDLYQDGMDKELQRLVKETSAAQVQRMESGVAASNAKNIQELKSELGDLKTTVQSHDETIQEIESMREEVDDAYDDMDPEDIELNIPGMEDQDQSLLEEFKTSLGNMGEKMNPFSEDGQKTMSKGVVGGGLALAAFFLGGGVLGAGAATMAPILGDAMAAGIGDGGQAVPAEVVETLGQSLAASEDFAKQIANDPQLAERLASNETLIDNLTTASESREQTTGVGDAPDRVPSPEGGSS
jgi:hypothetical protein